MTNIIQAIEDENLFRNFLGDDLESLESWKNWETALRCLYGLPTTESERDLIRECTGRSELMPTTGFSDALFLTGRRSGKSRVAALIAAFEACLSGNETKLSRGEIGLVAVISPTKFQSRIVQSYIRAIFDSTPILQNEIIAETKEGFTLRNSVEISCLVASFKHVRGHSLLLACIDEACFIGYDDESKVKSDTELVRALKPALATTGGKLIAISSPYAPRGWCYQQHKRNFGNEAGKTLVWNCASRVMNSTLPIEVVESAYAEDPHAAAAEYGGRFRDDISSFVPRELVEALVVPGRIELPPMHGLQYSAFADVSGGRSDDAAICIAHRVGRTVIIDCLERYKSPHNPNDVISRMCQTLRRYGIDRCLGDAYAAEFTKNAFESNGIRYERCSTSVWKSGAEAKNKVAKPKSQLYLELLPRLSTGEIELLDNDLLVTQLASLERKTRSGGRDIIDHPPGAHDDLSNVVAGACDACTNRPIVAGVMLEPTGAGPLSTYQQAAARFEHRKKLFEREQQRAREFDENRETTRQMFRSVFGRNYRR